MIPLVLTIGEDQLNPNAIIKLLKPEFDVLEASSGADAISTFQMVHNRVRLITIRHPLPDIDVLQLIKALKSINFTAEIIVICSLENTNNIINWMKAGAFNCLVEPIKKDNIINELKEAKCNINFLTKFDNLFRKLLHSKKPTELINEFLTKRRAENKILSKEEIEAIFSDDMGSVDSKTHFKSSTKKRSTLLLVEDDLYTQDTLANIIKQQRHNIIEALDGKSALEQARKHPEIDLIILDIGLPDITGVKLLPQLKKILPDTEIIMLTAFSDKKFVVESLQQFAREYIVKPFERENIIKKITKSLQRKHLTTSLKSIGRSLLEIEVPERLKYLLLDELAEKRMLEDKTFLMEDIYVFFPSLEKLEIPRNKSITEEDLCDGVYYFIEELKNKLMEKSVNP